MREKLLADGSASPAEGFEDADVCVINTCTVTREADKDALRLARRIARRNPAARLIVTGCLASRAPEEILAAAPGAVVVGNEGKDNIPAMLGCDPLPGFSGITDFHQRSRAFVKAQDGCNMHCAYCIIPSVRPTLSCKPYAALEAEVRGLLAAGYREIVLCGIRLGRYLVQHEGKRVDFVAMLQRLLALDGDFRLRLSSFEITDVTDRFLRVAAASGGRLCPSFHLPLQSGSEAVLRRMRRWYTASFYERRLAALRESFPDAGLFTDLMVGFPGEGPEEFEESLSFVERSGFSGLHIFRFSERSGTEAVGFADRVPEAEIVARSARARGLDARLRDAFAARAVGTRRRVLVERGPGGLEGTTEHFLRVALDRDPGAGLAWARVVSAGAGRGQAAVEA